LSALTSPVAVGDGAGANIFTPRSAMKASMGTGLLHRMLWRRRAQCAFSRLTAAMSAISADVTRP